VFRLSCKESETVDRIIGSLAETTVGLDKELFLRLYDKERATHAKKEAQ